MPAGSDNKHYALHKKIFPEVSTVVDKDIIIEKKTDKMKGGGAGLNG